MKTTRVGDFYFTFYSSFTMVNDNCSPPSGEHVFCFFPTTEEANLRCKASFALKILAVGQRVVGEKLRPFLRARGRAKRLPPDGYPP